MNTLTGMERPPFDHSNETRCNNADQAHEKRAFENGLKLGAMLNEYMNAGGSVSMLLELINQVDKAKELKGGVIHGA